MSTNPNAIRAESDRIPYASIEVRHGTPLHVTNSGAALLAFHRYLATAKWCNACGGHKPEDQFWRSKRNKDGLQSHCKPCVRNERQDRRFGKNGKTPVRDTEFYRTRQLATYGLTISDYDAMALSQGNVCAICDNPETRVRTSGPQRLAVDHCHATGAVRGLLCGRCNRALGFFDDNPERLMRAAEYLTQTSNAREAS